MNNQHYNLRVLREGLISTIQDNGFTKLQHIGITTGGAIDDFSYKLGNIILSNNLNTPSIEFAKLGPKLLVEQGSLNIAITGRVNFLLKLNGDYIKGSTNRSYFLNKGDEIDVQSTENSNYGYIAIKNGILTSSFEGSYSINISRNFKFFIKKFINIFNFKKMHLWPFNYSDELICFVIYF